MQSSPAPFSSTLLSHCLRHSRFARVILSHAGSGHAILLCVVPTAMDMHAQGWSDYYTFTPRLGERSFEGSPHS